MGATDHGDVGGTCPLCGASLTQQLPTHLWMDCPADPFDDPPEP